MLQVQTTAGMTTSGKVDKTECRGVTINVEEKLTFPPADYDTFTNSNEKCATGKEDFLIFCHVFAFSRSNLIFVFSIKQTFLGRPTHKNVSNV